MSKYFRKDRKKGYWNAVNACFFVYLALCALPIYGDEMTANLQHESTPLSVMQDDRRVMLDQQGLQTNLMYTMQSTNLLYSPYSYGVENNRPYQEQPIWYQAQSEPASFSERIKQRPDFSLFSFDFLWSPKNDTLRFRKTQNSAMPQDRARMLQGASMSASYVPGLGSRGLEMTRIRVGATMGLPGIGKNCYLLVSPSFEPTWVDWDGAEQLPRTLYSASLSCTMIKQLNDRWGAMLSVHRAGAVTVTKPETLSAVRLLAGLSGKNRRDYKFASVSPISTEMMIIMYCLLAGLFGSRTKIGNMN